MLPYPDPPSTAPDPTLAFDDALRWLGSLGAGRAEPPLSALDAEALERLRRYAAHLPDHLRALMEDRAAPTEASELTTLLSLGLAARGLAALGWTDEAEALEAAIGAARAVMASDPSLYLHGGWVEEVGDEEVFPADVVLRVARSTDPARRPRTEVLEAFARSALHTETHAAVQALVRDDPTWRDAYRACAAADLGRVSVPLGDPHLAGALELVLDRPLPHLGKHRALTARLAEERGVLGTEWRWGEERRAFVRRGAPEVRLGDEVLEVTIELEHLEPDLVLDATRLERASRGALELAAQGRPAEATRLGRRAVRAIGSAGLAPLLLGAEAFRAGRDLGELEPAVIAAIERTVRARVLLDRAMGVLEASGGELARDLLALDDELVLYGDATRLLDDDAWERAHGGERPPSALFDAPPWWAARASNERALPDARLEEALVGLATRSSSSPSRSTTIAPWLLALVGSSPGRVMDVGSRGLSAGASVGLAATAAQRGRVLAPVVGPDGEGRVVVAELSLDVGRARAAPLGLGPRAERAFADAYRAAASLTASGLAPHPIDAHEIRLVLPEGVDAVDGGSIGLSLAVGLASLWSGRAIDGSVALSGELALDDGAREWRVAPVAGEAEKARAVAAWTGEGGARATLILPELDDPDAAPTLEAGALRVERVDRVWTAVARALGTPEGEALDVGPTSLDGLSLAELRSALRSACEAVQEQDVPAGGLGWSTLAGRVRAYRRALGERTGERRSGEDAALLARALRWEAVARAQSGDVRGLEELRAEGASGSEDIELSLAVAELAVAVRALPRMCGATDPEIIERATALAAALGASVAGIDRAAPPERLAPIVGMAWGTLGRFHLGRGEPGDDQRAMQWLELGCIHHEEHAPHELARSCIYLSQCQRALGRPDDARRTCERGRRALAHTRRESASYERSTRTFLDLETARVLLALGEPLAAELFFRSVERRARGGPVPRLRAFALRGLAWAQRELGVDDGPSLDELESMAAADPVCSALLEDARAPHEEARILP